MQSARLRVVLIAGIGPATHARMSMADLRAGCAAEGLAEARTLLATGNLLVRSDLPDAEVIAAVTRILARYGVDRAVYVRDHSDLATIAQVNPFPGAAKARPAHLLVRFLTAPVTTLAAWSGPERLAAVDRAVFLDYVDGVGTSRLTGALLDRLIGQPGTARNWNTLGKLIAAGQTT